MNQNNPLDGNLHFLSMFINILVLLCSTWALPRTDPPILPSQPFLLMWNAPTELCGSRFAMPLDLSQFHFITSTLKTATNQSISMFYTDRFGIFPYVDEETGQMYDDGLPQLVDLKEHHELAEDDIEFYIPYKDQPGLAVLDFEEWRPQWDRNWGSKDIYRQISVNIIKKKNKLLSEDEAEELAKIAFERAAKKYFLRSIHIGKKLRPKRLWGFYLYPDCYNYDYMNQMVGYTGKCPAIEQARNDGLNWLWKESTALFPSIYLEQILKDSKQARLYVRHRIQEAMRVSMLPSSSHSIPIYAFIRPLYKDTTDVYMSEFDLVNTIGEAAALGVAGIVSWGDMNVTSTEESCYDARRHLENVMNSYILNVSMATQLCSKAICQGKGRCVRKQWNEDVFLHLNPMHYQIVRQNRGGPLTVRGGFSQDDVNWFDQHFNCICYSEKSCRKVLMVNFLPGAKVRIGNRGADKSTGIHLLILLCLKYIVI